MTQNRPLTWQDAAPTWPRSVDAKLAHRLVDMHFIGELERASAAEIAAFQQTQLRRLLSFCAYAGSESFELSSLSGLPVCSREDYRAANAARAASLAASGANWLPTEHGQLIANHTSGSVGVPLAFWCSEFSVRLNLAYYRYDLKRLGRDLRKTQAAMRLRMPAKNAEGASTSTASTEELIVGNPWQHTMGTVLRFGRHYQPHENARWLAELRPDYLLLPPLVLASLIEAFDEFGIAAPAIEQISTFADTVTPALRADARRLFGARIADRYSCEEIGPLALQCLISDAHHHVCVGNAIVEVLRDDGSPAAYGQQGRVVATGLHNYASPAVRYELGDVAALRPCCPCGFQGATLTDLLGRKRFLLKLADGSRKYVWVDNWLKVAPITEHRITQTALDRLLVEVVCQRPLTEAEHRALRLFLEQGISPDAHYDIRQVGAIAWSKTSKRQDFVSLLD